MASVNDEIETEGEDVVDNVVDGVDESEGEAEAEVDSEGETESDNVVETEVDSEGESKDEVEARDGSTFSYDNVNEDTITLSDNELQVATEAANEAIQKVSTSLKYNAASVAAGHSIWELTQSWTKAAQAAYKVTVNMGGDEVIARELAGDIMQHYSSQAGATLEESSLLTAQIIIINGGSTEEAKTVVRTIIISKGGSEEEQESILGKVDEIATAGWSFWSSRWLLFFGILVFVGIGAHYFVSTQKRKKRMNDMMYMRQMQGA